MRRLVPFVVSIVVLVACTEEPPPASSTVAPSTTDASIPTETTATVPPTTTAEGSCQPGDVMLADGSLADFDPPSSDATRIAGITWRAAGECQTFTIAFATEDGAPATTPPPLSARLLRGAGVLRIETTAIDSVVTDQLVESGAVERLFVPVTEEGSRFVDLVLSAPVVARARLQTSPARLELEMQPGGPETVGHPLMTGNVVLVEPGSAAVASSVLDVTGYSTGEATPLDLHIERGGQTLVTTSLELEDSPAVWTAFHLVIQVGTDTYDTLRVTDVEGAVVAAIPFSR